MSNLLRYYGLDWIGECCYFLGMMWIGQKSRKGFFSVCCGNACFIGLSLLVGSWPMMVSSAANLMLNIRSIVRWRRIEEMAQNV